MRRRLLWLVPLLGLLCTACSSHGNGSTGAGGMMTTGGIPDPGTSDMVDNDFTAVAPDSTPDQATPLGVAAGADVNVWVNGNSIGGSDTENHFVFKSSATAGAFTFDICFMAPVTAMTATLWKVEDAAAVMPPVGTWTSSGTCVQGPMAGAPLEASTEYLFGLSATGGAGMYSA